MANRLDQAIADMKAAVKNRDREAFVLPENRFHKRKADELTGRRHIKRMVRPENSAGLVSQLPGPGEITHAILRGDFVLGDALPSILAVIGYCPHLLISTLGLSVKNAETLKGLLESGAAGKITLVMSNYFRAVTKLSTYHKVSTVLRDIAALKIARSHAKVILAANEKGDAFVFEGSANLRSSDTLEQLTIFNDRGLHDFHAVWMGEIKTLDPKETDSRSPEKKFPK